MPPEVGYADTSSDIVKPMIRMKTPRIGHDHEIEIGPPLLKPAPKLVKQPARIEMIENEIAKLEKPDQRPVQVLPVPELGQVLLVVGQLWGCVLGRRFVCFGHADTFSGSGAGCPEARPARDGL